MEGYWQIMPDWLKKAFQTEPLVNQGVKMCAYQGQSNQQMLLNLCELLLNMSVQVRQILLEKEMMSQSLRVDRSGGIITP